MSRKLLLQASAVCLGVVVFVVILTLARTRFSGNQATNLLGVLQDQPQNTQETDAHKQRNVTDYAEPMYCCPAAHEGQACRLVDSIENKSCGRDVNGEFQPGEEFQPNEAGFEACEAACEAS